MIFKKEFIEKVKKEYYDALYKGKRTMPVIIVEKDDYNNVELY